MVGMSKDYHEQTDQFQIELSDLINKYTIGDQDSPEKEVLNSPLEPRLNFQTLIGCLQCEMQELMMTGMSQEFTDDDFAEEGDSPAQL
jgi:hypothetical protein